MSGNAQRPTPPVRLLALLAWSATAWPSHVWSVDLEPLRGLTGIRGLALGYNQITDVEPLSAYTQLHGLDLSYNSTFSDMQPLLDHSGLQIDTTPWIEEFDFRDTSVSCTDIDAFRALGAPTLSDCP
jgi:hypothetical protein